MLKATVAYYVFPHKGSTVVMQIKKRLFHSKLHETLNQNHTPQ